MSPSGQPTSVNAVLLGHCAEVFETEFPAVKQPKVDALALRKELEGPAQVDLVLEHASAHRRVSQPWSGYRV